MVAERESRHFNWLTRSVVTLCRHSKPETLILTQEFGKGGVVASQCLQDTASRRQAKPHDVTFGGRDYRMCWWHADYEVFPWKTANKADTRSKKDERIPLIFFSLFLSSSKCRLRRGKPRFWGRIQKQR